MLARTSTRDVLIWLLWWCPNLQLQTKSAQLLLKTRTSSFTIPMKRLCKVCPPCTILRIPSVVLVQPSVVLVQPNKLQPTFCAGSKIIIKAAIQRPQLWTKRLIRYLQPHNINILFIWPYWDELWFCSPPSNPIALPNFLTFWGPKTPAYGSIYYIDFVSQEFAHLLCYFEAINPESTQSSNPTQAPTRNCSHFAPFSPLFGLHSRESTLLYSFTTSN